VFLTVPCDPRVIETDAAGLAAGQITIDANTLVDDWLIRFGSTFQEFRIRGVTFDITSLRDSSGVTMFSMTEDNFATPSFTVMTSMTNWLVPNSSDNPRSHKVIRWKAIDLSNLEFEPIDHVGPVAALNFFTNLTTFNAPTEEKLFLVRPTMVVEFRGIGVPT